MLIVHLIALLGIIITGCFWHDIRVASQKNAFALTVIFGFADESFVPFLPKNRHKLFVVMRKHKCKWEKVVVFRKLLPHSHQVTSQQVLPCQVENSRKMINALPRLHLWKQLNGWWSIPPSQIPVRSGFPGQMVVETKLKHLFHNVIVRHVAPANHSIPVPLRRLF